MPDVTLPLTASADEIASAIRHVQARCRLRICNDPDELSRVVREQLDRGERAAAAVGCGLKDLRPEIDVAEMSLGDDGDITVVSVRNGGLRIHRSGVFTSSIASCSLKLTIRRSGYQGW